MSFNHAEWILRISVLNVARRRIFVLPVYVWTSSPFTSIPRFTNGIPDADFTSLNAIHVHEVLRSVTSGFQSSNVTTASVAHLSYRTCHWCSDIHSDWCAVVNTVVSTTVK